VKWQTSQAATLISF